MAGDPDLQVVADPGALAAAGAEHVVRACRTAVAGRGEFAIALSGGDTPKPLYERLGEEPFRSRVPWDKVRVFWGDERGVPPTDPRSNFRMAEETLLRRVPVRPERVHRMPAERADLDEAADEYADVLRVHVPAGAGGWPRLDLVLLGLGEDAHVASLFPGAPVLREARRTVVAYYVPAQGMNRMTLTAPVLSRAGEVLFLVSGASKAEALWRVLEGPRRPDVVPAQLIRPVGGGRVLWLADAASTSRLSRRAAARSEEGAG